MKPHPESIAIISPTGKSGTNFLSKALEALGVGQPCPVPEDWILFLSDKLERLVQRAVELREERGWLDDKEAARKRWMEDSGTFLKTTFLEDQLTRGPLPVIRKTPNSKNLDLFPELFPNDRLILLVRDGRDTTESLVQAKHFRDYPSAFANWALHGRIILDFAAKNQSTKDRKWTLIHYEDLIREPARTFGDILAFLGHEGREPDASRLEALPLFGSIQGDPHKWAIAEKTPDFNPFGRWKTWPRPRIKEFQKLAGETFTNLGYQW